MGVLTTLTIGLVGPAVVVAGGVTVSVAIASLRDEPDVLDLLIHGLLQELVELLNLCLCLVDVREFDLDGSRKAVAAVLRQAEFLAVVGAELDGHDV